MSTRKELFENMDRVTPLEIYTVLLAVSHDIESGPLADRVDAILARMRREKRMREGEERHQYISGLRCACGHPRAGHRADFSQMYQWFNECQMAGCSCKAWDHEDGDPLL